MLGLGVSETTLALRLTCTVPGKQSKTDTGLLIMLAIDHCLGLTEVLSFSFIL